MPTDIFLKRIVFNGAELRKQRETVKNVSRKTMAEDTGINYNTLRWIEEGKTSNPHLAILVTISRYLDLPILHFVIG